ncbi:MAG: hypothetical protein LBG72_03845, partial [Spirochaetaceae bacterium]|nr:hypothetical protein [Spirochaetaceae bacterium]
SVIGSIAWPLCALAVALLFRKPVGALLGAVAKIRIGGFELETRLNDIFDTLAGNSGLKTPQISASPLAAELEQLAALNPAAAIPYAYSKIELAIKEKMRLIDPAVNLFLVNNLPRHLFKLNKIGMPVFETLNKLRQIRNDTAHSGGDPSPAAASAYCRNAVLLVNIINAIET